MNTIPFDDGACTLSQCSPIVNLNPLSIFVPALHHSSHHHEHPAH